MRNLTIPALVAATLLAACDESPVDPPLASQPPPIAATISDAVHGGGNPHFFFLPPMVESPAPTGTFDGTLDPVVEICVWDGAACGPILARYNSETGPGSETVRMDAADGQYMVSWHTDDVLERFPIEPEAGESYRIRVLVGPSLLGYADVQVVSSGGQLKNVETGEYIPLLDGRTLPIKFRLEEGVLDYADVGAVSSGRWHTCAVRSDGAAYCWGTNEYGGLGVGYRSAPGAVFPTPQKVVGGHQFTAVTTGHYHACAIATDGAAWCWGYNNVGQLGDGTMTSTGTPVLVQGGHEWAELSAGNLVTCGVTTGGDGYCWGYNGRGALGIGSLSYATSTPVPVAGGLSFESISIQYDHACGLTTGGDGYCWGYDWGGQTGQGTTWMDGVLRRPTPARIPGLTFRALDAGWNHSCGVTTSGEGLCWGYNYYGQLGSGSRTGNVPYSVPVPTSVAGDVLFLDITAGAYVSCGLEDGGAGWCWGYNGFGAVGDGTTSPLVRESPTSIAGAHSFVSLSAGHMGACGVTTDAEARCWGQNRYGQVGDGTRVDRTVPTLALDLEPPSS